MPVFGVRRSYMSVARKYINVAGCRSEVFSVLPEKEGSLPKIQFLVIPGNPGAATYYVPFMLALWNAFKGSAEVSALSQMGHGYKNGSKLFTLKEQVVHKAAYVREQMLGIGRPPIALIGHSIGAYMAIQAAKQLEEDNRDPTPAISKVVAVFPFLSVDKSSLRQQGLKLATCFPSLLGVLLGFLGVLPHFLQRLVIKLASGGMDEHGIQATLGLLHASTGRSISFLGHTEFQDLACPSDWASLKILGDRCVVCYAPQDTWFPNNQLQEMKKQLPTLQILEPEGMRHGFCVSVQQSQRLAELLHPLLMQCS